MMSKFSNIVKEILIEHLLIEGIEEVKPYFPNIPDNAFIQIINLDPTYTGGNSLGKYGKWLLTRYNQEFKKNNNPVIDNNIKNELTIYDTFKKDIEKDIGKKLDQIKSFNELSEITDQYKDKEASISNRQQRRNIKNEAEKEYEDDEWLIIVPKTEEASCYYGANTKWCTAGRKDNEFERYAEQGPLFIIINKKTGEKWQFHFETEVFTDDEDSPLTKKELRELNARFPEKVRDAFLNLALKAFCFSYIDGAIKLTDDLLIDLLKHDENFFIYLGKPSIKVQKFVAKNYPELAKVYADRFKPEILSTFDIKAAA